MASREDGRKTDGNRKCVGRMIGNPFRRTFNVSVGNSHHVSVALSCLYCAATTSKKLPRLNAFVISCKWGKKIQTEYTWGDGYLWWKISTSAIVHYRAESKSRYSTTDFRSRINSYCWIFLRINIRGFLAMETCHFILQMYILC